MGVKLTNRPFPDACRYQFASARLRQLLSSTDRLLQVLNKRRAESRERQIGSLDFEDVPGERDDQTV